jgi:acyl carrier protein
MPPAFGNLRALRDLILDGDCMDTIDAVRSVLRDALHLGDRAARLGPDSRLLGGLPEFDSMAVVAVVTMIEDQFGITVADDELSAEVFETVGSLCSFLEGKLAA